MRSVIIFLYVMGFLHAQDLTFGQSPVSSMASVAAAPTATIFSNETEVCLGDAVAAYLYFSGDGPWDAVVSNKNGVYLEVTDVTSPHAIWLEPTEDDTYQVTHVEDSKGIPGNTYGAVSLVVYDPTPVSILLERRAYLKTEPGVSLKADTPGGTFTGNGVSVNVFYPGIASTAGSPHTVTYTYYNQHGCISSDAIDIHVLLGDAGVVLLSGTEPIDDLCDDGRTYVIQGSNGDNLPGAFELREAGSSVEVPGHITDEDPVDDLAILNPAGLSGAYEIIYSYGLEGLTVSASFQFQVSNLGLIAVPGLPEVVCSGDEPYPLVPDLAAGDPGAIYLFSGPGVTGSQEDGYYYDPGSPDAELGDIVIELEYSASNGCSALSTYSVNNRFSPDVNFEFSPICMPKGGGLVEFKNLTNGKYAVESWDWDFGDPESGSENSSNLEEPSHFYSGPGFVLVSLSATTAEGCVAVSSVDTSLVDQPVADFSWITDCFVAGEKISFVDQSVSDFSPLDTLMWTFRTKGGGVLGVIGSNSSSDTIEFPFTVRDSYQVDLYVQNQVGCEDEITREIVLQPTIKLTAAGYKEGFNGQRTDWFAVSEDAEVSWRLEEPDFTGFEQVAGDKAWFTDLPPEGEGYLENSWVQSPCFDFTSRKNPLIKMDLMKSFTPGYDGAVIQYQDAVTEGWKTIGEPGEGVNWYNVSGLMNQPGESSFGWGLQLFDPDSKWMNASHDLDLLAGLPHVKLRIIIATGGARDIGNQGFAFDNIFIGDRIRKSVLEHFTNSSSVSCMEADAVVDRYAGDNSASVIDLQYHTAFPGSDPMNDNNPYPSSIREFNYGVQNVPHAILNGGFGEGTVYNFSGPSDLPDEEILKQASLEIPVFDVNLVVQWMENSLEATTTVTCLADTFTSNLQLYVAVIETSVTAYTGANQDTSFRNVVLDMLPSASGKLLGNAWSKWMTETRSYTWDYKDYIEDNEELAVVAFVQNRDNRQILQAAARYLTPQVGTAPQAEKPAGLSIYPNPAADLLYINLGSGKVGMGQLRIMDLSGKTVIIREVDPGNTIQQLDLSNLSRGIYIISWEESGMVKGRTKMVKSH